jgi:hypothetical protein
LPVHVDRAVARDRGDELLEPLAQTGILAADLAVQDFGAQPSDLGDFARVGLRDVGQLAFRLVTTDRNPPPPPPARPKNET